MKTPRLSKSNIDYLDYVWNFTSGCTNGCTYCYARVITERFKDHYPNGFEPTIYPEALLSPLHLKKPSVIGVCFMGDLFGFDPDITIKRLLPSCKASLKISLWGWVKTTIEQCPQHTFLFLTKQPQRLPDWSPFPDNAWVGVSVCNNKMLDVAVDKLEDIQAKIKYLSCEPLLERLTLSLDYAFYYSGINWITMGACTGSHSAMIEMNKQYPDLTLMPYGRQWSLQPRISSVKEIVDAADKAGIPVFLKNNLEQLILQAIYKGELKDPLYRWAFEGKLRQELPCQK